MRDKRDPLKILHAKKKQKASARKEAASEQVMPLAAIVKQPQDSQ
jgi:hypothetical protein